MVVHFEKLSRALDFFNANRVESEQMEWAELIQDIKNPLDEVEILKLCVELYEN